MQLGGDRRAAAAKVEKSARAFAEAVAALERVAVLQALALTQSGVPDAWRMASPGDLRVILAQACSTAGASTGWLNP